MSGRGLLESDTGGGDGSPALVVLNRQRSVRVPMDWLRAFAKIALSRSLDHSRDGRFALRSLPEVIVTVVSDRKIAEVHDDFMGIPTATDVITFQHGDIVVSAEMAVRRAGEFGHGLREELALYVVHGFLHLNGFTDEEAAERDRMHRLQETVWRESLRLLEEATKG
jgi:probable rRNA maturation factor